MRICSSRGGSRSRIDSDTGCWPTGWLAHARPKLKMESKKWRLCLYFCPFFRSLFSCYIITISTPSLLLIAVAVVVSVIASLLAHPLWRLPFVCTRRV